jgi:hypothetical protein
MIRRADILHAAIPSDIIAVTADSVEDVPALEKVAFVMKGGGVVKHEMAR